MPTCSDHTSLEVVEYTWVYPIYQAFFMIIYFGVSFACAKPLVELWRRTGQVTLPSNRLENVAFSPHAL